MSKHSKTILLLIFSACLFSLTLASGKTPVKSWQDKASEKPRQYKCNADNRPDPDSCINKPNVPVCGYYKDDCPLEICGLGTYNGCAACSDSRVLYYTKTECKAESVVQSCSKGICDNLPEGDLEVYEPVCGLRKGGSKGDKTRTFDNYCQACKNSRYPWYQAGVCDDDKHYCKGKRSKTCSTKYNPVCAHFSNDITENAYTNVYNGCEACSDKDVDFYTVGECGGPSRNEETYCLPNNRPDICTLELNEVCGFYLDSNGNLAHKVLSNPCAACSEEGIIYHTPGPCVFKCNKDPNIIFDCIGTFEPVCGEYTKDGKTYKVSLRNSCIGCYYSGKPIDTYTDGLCPGDKGIQCENDAGAFLEGLLHPVCAYDKQRCKADECRKTFAEPILACSDPKTVWYRSGECPEDKGVPCDDYREKPSDGSGFLYENVCGHSRNNKRTYADQYDACGRDYVRYFTEGPC